MTIQPASSKRQRTGDYTGTGTSTAGGCNPENRLSSICASGKSPNDVYGRITSFVDLLRQAPSNNSVLLALCDQLIDLTTITTYQEVRELNQIYTQLSDLHQLLFDKLKEDQAFIQLCKTFCADIVSVREKIAITLCLSRLITEAKEDPNTEEAIGKTLADPKTASFVKAFSDGSDRPALLELITKMPQKKLETLISYQNDALKIPHNSSAGRAEIISVLNRLSVDELTCFLCNIKPIFCPALSSTEAVSNIDLEKLMFLYEQYCKRITHYL